MNTQDTTPERCPYHSRAWGCRCDLTTGHEGLCISHGDGFASGYIPGTDQPEIDEQLRKQFRQSKGPLRTTDDYFRPEWELVAVSAAADSGCLKSQRGVAIFECESQLAHAANGPPKPFACQGDRACRAACNRVAVHAEQRALFGAARFAQKFQFADLIHAKIDAEGRLTASGPPSCWQCSRLILEAGIPRVWLHHSIGWRCYSALDFHTLTLKHNQLPHGKGIEAT